MSIGRERWLRLSRLFDEAVELEGPQRDAFVAAACADDPPLRAELERMLAADRTLHDFDAGAASAAAAQLLDEDEDARRAVGERLGIWRLRTLLGRGGMGSVYAAQREDGDTGQRAAIKRLQRRWDGSAQAQRFLQERRILAQMSHANIPALIDHGLDDEGRPWFALEFVDGHPLTDWADARTLGLRERIVLFLQVCRAVQHAHERFVVHRDLKPANILVDAGGRARVLDFGVAKRLDAGEGATGTGLFAGFTPEYAAPEQVSGGTITAATDVYALGVLLYQLLSGILPYRFEQADLRQAAEAITTRSPGRLDRALSQGAPEDVQARMRRRATTPAAYRRFVRGDLARIAQTALAKEPQRRYATVQALTADLQRFLDGRPVSVTGDTFAYRARKFLRRHRWGSAMAALALLALVGGSAGIAWQAERTRREAALAIQVKDYLIDMFRQADRMANAERRDARAMLGHAARRLRDLPPDSQVRYELLDVLLRLYNERALRADGLRLAQRELPHPPAWRGDGADPARLRALLAAMQLRKDEGDRESVAPTLLRALDSYPHTDSVDYAQALTLLGEVAGDSERPAEAEHWHARAHALLQRAVPPGDDRLTYSTVLLAGAITSQRRLRQARGLTEQALRDAPPASPARAYVCTMAALRRAAFGEFGAAAPLFEETRRLQAGAGVSRLGHYYLLTRTTNLFATGALDQADAQLASALDRPRQGRVAGDGDADLLWLRGEIALARGHADRAAQLLGQAVTHQAGAGQRGDNPLYLAALHAVALADAGRGEDAARALETADRLAHDSPAPSYATAMHLAARGRVASRAGRHADALQALRAALAELEAARRRPTDIHNQLRENRDAVRLRAWLAQAQRAAGDPRGAADTAAQAQRLAASTLGARHPFARLADAAAHPPGAD